MPASPKPSFQEYESWSREHLKIEISALTSRRRYEINAQGCQNSLQSHLFVNAIQQEIIPSISRHEIVKPTNLAFIVKPYDSVVEKSYRKNILNNNRFPREPETGWVTPDNCFCTLDDTIRTTIVARYLDDPERFAKRLDELAANQTLESRYVPRSLDSGYYAFHFYFKIDVEITDAEWKPLRTKLEAEIQITTQLQEVIKSLTRPFYQALRVAPRTKDESWKWDHRSPRFLGVYLGHTLHLLEAIIVQLRDASAKADATEVTDQADSQE